MKKFAVIPAVLVFLAAGTVYAQVYSYPSDGTISAGCVSLSSNLSYGSRGSEVTKLQQFLVSQNYPGGGSWMITGYFGKATVQALRNFQQVAGIPMTGYLDSASRSSIQTRTCGFLAGTAPTLPSTPITFPSAPPTYTSPTYPLSTPSFPYSIYPYGGVSITSLSAQNVQVGQTITIGGNGFDTTGTNTVHVGGATVVVPSNGTSLTFIVPSVPNGTHGIYITNSRGTSNSLALSITQAQSVCNTTPWYQPWNWFGQQYQCGIYSNVNLISIAPNWAAVGTTVKLKGTGFSPAGNAVYMGGNIIGVFSSTNSGTELSFTVPTQFQGQYGAQQVVPGHYPIRLVNATGSQSNSLTLSITQQSSSALSISGVSGPTSLTTGSLGTWMVAVNAPYGAYLNAEVTWGDGTTPSIPNFMPTPYPLGGSQTLTFSHVYNSPGTFTATFNVSAGGNNTNTSATKTVTVTAAPSGGSLNLNLLSPMQGSIGTTINFNGSGFTSTDNTVHFGIGGSRGVPSNNGTQISYVVPSYISACDLIQPGYFCGAPTQTVTPGVYPVYVTNSTGATNVLYFTVQ